MGFKLRNLKRVFFSLMLLLFFLFGCSKNKGHVGKNKINNDCVALNDSAVVLHFRQGVTDMSDRYFSLLDKAIECDSTYYLPVYNKSVYLMNNGDFESCLETLELILSRYKKEEPSIYSAAAECSFHINDTLKYRLFLREADEQFKLNFNSDKNKNNLIPYIYFKQRFYRGGGVGILVKYSFFFNDEELDFLIKDLNSITPLVLADHPKHPTLTNGAICPKKQLIMKSE